MKPNCVFDIQSLGKTIQNLVEEKLTEILPTRQAEFEERFRRDGDMAYGALNTELFQPVRNLLADSGLKAEPRLPGDFQESREWGNDDETHQQRWMWSMIIDQEGEAIGAIAVGSHHDHAGFRLPRSPEIVSLSAKSWDDAVAELAASMPEFATAQSFQLWYQNYLAQTQAQGLE